MKYRALRDGYIGGHYVFAGETFTHNGKKPSWAECLGMERKSGGEPDASDPPTPEGLRRTSGSDDADPASPEGYAGTREQ